MLLWRKGNVKISSTFGQKIIVSRKLVQKVRTYTEFSSKKTVLKFYCAEVIRAPNGLSNIEITYYFNYKPRFNGAFFRNNLPRIKEEHMS